MDNTRKKTIYCILIVVQTAVLLVACSQERAKLTTEPELVISERVLEDESEPPFEIDTVQVRDSEKILLEIIAALPDSAMGSSWDWPRSERALMLNLALQHGYILNSDRIFNVKRIMDSTHFSTQVVDGYWEIKAFEGALSDYVVLTHNIVGDGDEFFAFRYTDVGISSIPLPNLIPSNYSSAFFKSDKPAECEIELDDYFVTGLTYAFNGDTLSLLTTTLSLILSVLMVTICP